MLAQLQADQVVYKINTLPLPRCLLLSSVDGLRDGLVFAEMLCACNARSTIPDAKVLPPVERLRLVIRLLRGAVAADQWPPILQDGDVPEAIHNGNLEATCALAQLLSRALTGARAGKAHDAEAGTRSHGRNARQPGHDRREGRHEHAFFAAGRHRARAHDAETRARQAACSRRQRS